MQFFTFLVAFVAINQSFANPNPDHIPDLIVNNGNSTLEAMLGSNFTVECSVIDPTKTEYKPIWHMKDDSTITNRTDEPSLLGNPGWHKRSYLEFTSFKAAYAGNWTCMLWSTTENKALKNRSVELIVQDQVPWEVEFEGNRTEYVIEKGGNITWTLVIKNTAPTEHFHIEWTWPNGATIKPASMHPEKKSPEQRTQKHIFTLNNVTINGNYTVNVAKINEESKTLQAKVSFESDDPNSTSKPNEPTTKSPSASSGIRIESSFLGLVVAWFACRSVAFGTTA